MCVTSCLTLDWFGFTHTDLTTDKPDERSIVLYISSIRKHIAEKAQPKSPTHTSSIKVHMSTPKSGKLKVAELTVSPVTKPGVEEDSVISDTSTYTDGASSFMSWTSDPDQSDSAPKVIFDIFSPYRHLFQFVTCFNSGMAVVDVLLYSATVHASHYLSVFLYVCLNFVSCWCMS